MTEQFLACYQQDNTQIEIKLETLGAKLAKEMVRAYCKYLEPSSLKLTDLKNLVTLSIGISTVKKLKLLEQHGVSLKEIAELNQLNDNYQQAIEDANSHRNPDKTSAVSHTARRPFYQAKTINKDERLTEFLTRFFSLVKQLLEDERADLSAVRQWYTDKHFTPPAHITAATMANVLYVLRPDAFPLINQYVQQQLKQVLLNSSGITNKVKDYLEIAEKLDQLLVDLGINNKENAIVIDRTLAYMGNHSASNENELDGYENLNQLLAPEENPELSLNTLLYGPPGTGKTFTTTALAVKAADPEFFLQAWEEEWPDFFSEIKQRYDELVNEGRIAFTTFHQSFSYEDFIEGIRAEVDEESGNLNYQVQGGIFKTLCESARQSVDPKDKPHPLLNASPKVWKISLGKPEESEMRECFLNEGTARLGWNDTGDINKASEEMNPDEQAYWDSLGANRQGSLNNLANEMEIGDVLLCFKSHKSIQAIGIVTGDYYFDSSLPDESFGYAHSRKVEWIYKDIDLNIFAINSNKRLTRRSCYRLSRISWNDIQKALISQGYLHQDDTAPAQPQPHVLIIDEINRGNVSRIFGELITLLETDKREEGDDARTVTLPYSKESFSVPDNLYVIGTMNTADKSLTQLDIALRRRFDFVELLPEPELLNEIEVHEVNISQLLTVINQRIEILLDRDHLIGHSYFWPLVNIDEDAEDSEEKYKAELAKIFEKKIIPLLQEYFFSDWERIGWVLNDPAKEHHAHRFIQMESEEKQLNHLFPSKITQSLTDRRYRINKEAFMTKEAYQQILPVVQD